MHFPNILHGVWKSICFNHNEETSGVSGGSVLCLVDGWHTACEKQKIKWRTEMRKMKKFLAVALSAAMVLSVSVPAMAAGTEVAASSEVSSAEKALADAKAKEAEKQEAFEKAEDELKAALDTFNKLKAAAEEGKEIAPTKAEVKEKKADATAKAGDVTEARRDLSNAQAAEKAAEKAYFKAKADYNSKKAIYDVDKKNRENAEKALQEALDTEGEAAARLAVTKTTAAEAASKKDAEDAKEVYDGERDLTKAGDGGALGDYNEAIAYTKAMEAALKETNEEAREARTTASVYEALFNAAATGANAVKEAEKTVQEKQKALNTALEELNKAKEETRAAEAKLDTAGQRISEEMYNKAVINEQLAAEDEQAALDKLNDAKAKLLEIREQISKYQKDITDYDAAVKAEVKAQEDAAEAAADLVVKEAQVDVLAQLLDIANDRVEDIPAQIAAAKRELLRAQADPNYKVSPTYQGLINAERRVQDAIDALEELEGTYSENATIVAENAQAMLDKATREANAAEDKWNKKELEAQAAVDALKIAYGKYQAAIKVLYETVEVTEYVYDLDREAKILKPVSNDGLFLPLDRVDVNRNDLGIFIYLDEDGEPTKDENGNIIEYKAKKLVTYKQVQVPTGYVEDPETIEYYVYDSEHPVQVENAEGELVWVPQLIPVYAEVATGYETIDGEPISLYAKEACLIGLVAQLQDAYDAAVEYHKAMIEALAEAEAEYEYYHGYKPGEPTPEQKDEEAKEKAAQAAIIAKFSDVNEGDWFVPYVTHVYNKGIMTGMSESFFGVYNTLQRQDFTVMLWRMAGKPVVNTTTNFKDVEKGSYYEAAINWAYSQGIVRGYTDTEFGVGKNITREDFTVMLYRYNKYPTVKASIEGFKDASKVSGYAADAVQWAVAVGAITGKDNGTVIDPQAPIARCEAAKIIDVITDAMA
jgi:hypothetical protein